MSVGNCFARCGKGELRCLVAIACIAIQALIEVFNFAAGRIAQAGRVNFQKRRDAAFSRYEMVPERRYVIAKRRDATHPRDDNSLHDNLFCVEFFHDNFFRNN